MNAKALARNASLRAAKPSAVPECQPRPNSESVTLWRPPGRPGFHKIAAQFGVATATVQRIAQG